MCGPLRNNILRAGALCGLTLLIAASPAAVGSDPSANLPSLFPLTNQDRILVLAPHEDDEALGTGGLLQQAISAGAAVRIVYLTYGDHNELAFLLYRKRPWLTPHINQNMGEVRRREAINAMTHLGISPNHLVFLGYPDGGVLEIWKQHWGESPPLRSRSTHTLRVPYKDSFSYNKPHKGEAVVADIEQQLMEFRPTHIFVTQPVDGHPDHRACALFLQVALLNLAQQIPPAKVYLYPIHIGTWPHPFGFHPNKWLAVPKQLGGDGSTWWTLPLTPQQVHRKARAIHFYRSQMVDASFWMNAFARRNELFTTPRLEFLHSDRWGSGNPAMAHPETAAYDGETKTMRVTGAEYLSSEDVLLVRLVLRQPIDPQLGLSLYLFGYRKDQPFGTMPKLRIDWGLGRLRVRDQGIVVPNAPVHAQSNQKEVTLLIPWNLMGEPNTLFVQAEGLVSGLAVAQTGWETVSRSSANNPVAP